MFATVIAITKVRYSLRFFSMRGPALRWASQDLPDVEGDRQHNIETFATQLGVRTISLAVRARVRARLEPVQELTPLGAPYRPSVCSSPATQPPSCSR